MCDMIFKFVSGTIKYHMDDVPLTYRDFLTVVRPEALRHRVY